MENNVIKLMQRLEREFISAAQDTEKFVEGNMQSIKNLAQEVRKEVQEQKNSVAV